VIEQAAVLITGLALAHAFLDGNKRTAAIGGDTFLRLNGYSLVSSGDEFGRHIEALVIEHERSDAVPAALLAWLRAHAAPLPHPTE
jgi:death-on-curing protein